MALSEPFPARVHALTGFGMNSSNARRLVQFYEQAFGARVGTRERQDSHHFTHWVNIQGGAESTVLSLGATSIELLEFDHPGRPYPHELEPFDTRFQHLAIVVTDMQQAMERLTATDGWTAISAGGPQWLPANDGGVTAFKFRDPDGHPLELLQFSAGAIPAHWRASVGMDIHLGIDHSALSVADVARSVHFYETLGLALTHRTLNQGIEQERLDGVPAPVVDVISLTPYNPAPHVELLHYRTASRATHAALHSHDTAATRLIFGGGSDTANIEVSRLLQDPDGHFLQFGGRAERYPTTTTWSNPSQPSL